MALREVSPGVYFEVDGEWYAGREKFAAYKRREIELCQLARAKHPGLKWSDTLFSKDTWLAATLAIFNASPSYYGGRIEQVR